MVVGPKGVEISFQFSATFGGNGAKLDVEFGGTSYLTLDNSGITGSNVTVTTHNGASVITYPESPVIVYGDPSVIQLTIPLSSLGITSGTAINQVLAFRHYGNANSSGYNYFSNVIASTDCMLANTPLTTTQPKFSCSPGVSYLFQSPISSIDIGKLESSVYRLNLQDGSYTLAHGQLIGTANFNGANNFGYNPYDQYIWGHRTYRNHLIRVGSDWSVEYVTIPGLPSRWYNSGDITPDGIMYLFAGRDDAYLGVIERIDLKTLTRLTPIALPAVASTRGIIDLGYNPVDGNLYGVDRLHRLTRISLQPATLGNLTVVGATGIPGTNEFGAVYFDNDGTLFVSENKSSYAANDGGRVYRIPNVATNNATATFVIQGPRTYHNDGARCYLSPVVAYTIKGTVWNDANGNAIQNGTEVGVNTGSQNENGLWANLLDESGNVVSSEPVNLDGSYTLYAPVNGNYSIILSTTAQVPGNALITSSLPEGWVHTGTNKYGVADATNTTGIISNVVVANTNLTNLNFGIERLPESFNQSYLISTPATGQTIVLNGTGAADSPGPLTGSDPEDFASPGGSLAAKTVHITSPASNGTLFYDGIPIPPSTTNGSPFVINNYDPSKLSVVLSGIGYSEVIFEYAYVDIAGKVDPTPATYKIEWPGSLPVKLISFTVEKSEENTGLITWTTSEETNSDRFVIERSIDAKSWLALGEKLASGQSLATLTYHFADINPLAGTSYYRLKMIDKDATYTYSRIRSVSFGQSAIRLILQPNPVSDILLVKDEKGQDLALDKVKQIRIIDTQGVSVFSSVAPVSSEGINVRGLSSGTYIVKVTFADGAVSTHKIIVGR
jgi:hypothetical protein